MRDDGAQISARGLCMECGDVRREAVARQMAAGEGPFYDEWARGMAAFASRLNPPPR